MPEGGALVEVTLRTIQSRLLLRPGPVVNEIILGVLGRAQRLYGVRCCSVVFLSNHFHCLLLVDDALQLSRFMQHVDGNLSSEIGRPASSNSPASRFLSSSRARASTSGGSPASRATSMP